MFTRTLTIWDTVRTSLWALPLAMVLAAGASAYLALRINISVSGDPALYLYRGGEGNGKDRRRATMGQVPGNIPSGTAGL